MGTCDGFGAKKYYLVTWWVAGKYVKCTAALLGFLRRNLSLRQSFPNEIVICSSHFTLLLAFQFIYQKTNQKKAILRYKKITEPNERTTLNRAEGKRRGDIYIYLLIIWVQKISTINSWKFWIYKWWAEQSERGTVDKEIKEWTASEITMQ